MSPLEPREDLDGQSQLHRWGLTRKGLAQSRVQLSLRPSDKALVLLDERSQPGMVLRAQELRDHEGPSDAIAEETVAQ